MLIYMYMQMLDTPEEKSKFETLYYTHRRTFQELDGDRLFYFRYNSMVDGVVSGIEANGIDPEAVVINGMVGDFYQSTDESEGNTLMWFNQDENICFVIFGSFDKTVMMRIAENVILESSAN